VAYRDEEALVRHFLCHLRKMPGPLGAARICKEFYYQNGRADVVAIVDGGEVVAFEAKLSRWREALQQAYRNTCFAHRSYVVLPREAAAVAAKFTPAFDRRRVGLCEVSRGGLRFLSDPPKAEPIQCWLTERVSESAGRQAGAHSVEDCRSADLR